MTVPKTLFVVMDGIPTDVIERVATPNLDQITASGGFGRAYVGGETGGASESPTISAVGYQSLLTGTWANKHQVFDNEVASPNYAYWDIFRMAKTHAPGLSTALFSTWEDNRTKLIGDGLAVNPQTGLNKEMRRRWAKDQRVAAPLGIQRVRTGAGVLVQVLANKRQGSRSPIGGLL